MELVDLETWPRKEHFQFFSGLSFPFYNVTSALDVTKFYPWVKERKYSFYYSLIYATMTVMNGLPDYLYKIRGDQVVKHDHLDPSFVVMDGNTHLLKIVTDTSQSLENIHQDIKEMPGVAWTKTLYVLSTIKNDVSVLPGEI